jgi:prevent-host-death family protein
MEQAEKENVRFLVSRRGKPKVVILSVEDYLRNVVKKDQLLAEIQLNAQKSGLDKITEGEIEAEILSYRLRKRKSKKPRPIFLSPVTPNISPSRSSKRSGS